MRQPQLCTDTFPVEIEISYTLLACLQDHTIDQRGDIGSQVRIEAIKAVQAMVEYGMLEKDENATRLLAHVVGLAVEKLDKVRAQAWLCLQKCSERLPLRSLGSSWARYAAACTQSMLTCTDNVQLFNK